MGLFSVRLDATLSFTEKLERFPYSHDSLLTTHVTRHTTVAPKFSLKYSHNNTMISFCV
jgi:hypothetical protein